MCRWDSDSALVPAPPRLEELPWPRAPQPASLAPASPLWMYWATMRKSSCRKLREVRAGVPNRRPLGRRALTSPAPEQVMHDQTGYQNCHVRQLGIIPGGGPGAGSPAGSSAGATGDPWCAGQDTAEFVGSLTRARVLVAGDGADLQHPLGPAAVRASAAQVQQNEVVVGAPCRERGWWGTWDWGKCCSRRRPAKKA